MAQAREKAELRQLRASLVHKPMPILQAPGGVPTEPRKSDKPLTVPKSPQFQTKERAVRRRSVSLA